MPRLLSFFVALGLVLTLASSSLGNDQPDAAFWEMFDRHHPDLAGQGPDLWEQATEAAQKRTEEGDVAGFESLRRLAFQALVQTKLDARNSQEDVEGRKAALEMFQRHVATLDKLRGKAPEELAPEELRELIRASVGVAQYVNEGRIEALELQIDELHNDLAQMDARMSELEKQLVEGAAAKAPPADSSGDSRPGRQAASRNDYRAYLKYSRIDSDSGYDRSAVRVVGAIQNRTDVPTAFRFKVVAQRSSGQGIGLKTVTTPKLSRMEVFEINERVGVTHSAYVRKVDIQQVERIR